MSTHDMDLRSWKYDVVGMAEDQGLTSVCGVRASAFGQVPRQIRMMARPLLGRLW